MQMDKKKQYIHIHSVIQYINCIFILKYAP